MIDKTTSLRERLAEKRGDTGIKQGEIGKLLKMKQGTVSLYEREPERLRSKGVRFAIKFIAAYGFTKAEARDMARELFQDVLQEFADEPSSTTTSLLDIEPGSHSLSVKEAELVEIRWADDPTSKKRKRVYKDQLLEHDPDTCLYHEFTDDDLVSIELSESLKVGKIAFISDTRVPKEGDILVFRKKGVPGLIFTVCRENHDGDMVEKLGAGGRYTPIVYNDPSLEKIGMSLTERWKDRASKRRPPLPS